MKRKVKAISKENGETIYNFSSDAANSDPIRAARIMPLVKEGDPDAIRVMLDLQDSPMYYFDDEE